MWMTIVGFDMKVESLAAPSFSDVYNQIVAVVIDIVKIYIKIIYTKNATVLAPLRKQYDETIKSAGADHVDWAFVDEAGDISCVTQSQLNTHTHEYYLRTLVIEQWLGGGPRAEGMGYFLSLLLSLQIS